MSLDVYLTMETDASAVLYPERIFIREDGSTKEITRDEWDARFPGREPEAVSSCHSDGEDGIEVFSANITHNLGAMAREAGIYYPVWRPEEVSIERAEQLIEPLKAGLLSMKANPDHFRTFDAENGWGTYDQFVPWLERYLRACEEYPQAKVDAYR